MGVLDFPFEFFQSTKVIVLFKFNFKRLLFKYSHAYIDNNTWLGHQYKLKNVFEMGRMTKWHFTIMIG